MFGSASSPPSKLANPQGECQNLRQAGLNLLCVPKNEKKLDVCHFIQLSCTSNVLIELRASPRPPDSFFNRCHLIGLYSASDSRVLMAALLLL